MNEDFIKKVEATPAGGGTLPLTSLEVIQQVLSFLSGFYVLEPLFLCLLISFWVLYQL